MTLEALRYADAVTHIGSFSGAARRFGVTQPALSTAIAKLESHLGAKLFLRTPRGTEPTTFGETILPRISQAMSILARMETEAESLTLSGSGTVRVGTSPQIDKKIVAQFRDAVHGPDALVAGHDLTLLEAELDPLEEYLRIGSLDMLIIPALGVLPSYSHRLIDSDYLVLVEPKEDLTSAEGDTGNPVTVQQLSERELILSRHGCGITRMTEGMFREEGCDLVLSDVEVTNCSTLLGWADKGMGSVVLPERNVRGFPTRRIVREDGTFVEMFYEFIWNPESKSAVYLEMLADLLKASPSKSE
ncbi:Transcriptional regulator, LysR-family [Corynebacterium glyciniphilum AJ 3170]|uniref:Transcriptional regulator, LysR-family n=1 Tax=Corynebacterium glyciniphilum AJ 3170 TaxID=1404245 RepID=X5E8G6_9CORY|nr:LysR family transcriptional regulator [Corynebacterium glyciniphilum]AHW62966.1 Transcriptional regulator, LysR-family [Corynebacterium glyciniphilum AJ 3170]